MAYEQQINRDNPSAFVFLIDQSGSMDEKIEGGATKAAFVADVLNKTLYNLITRSTRDEEGCRHYFDIGVIAYGGHGVSGGFRGGLAGSELHELPMIERTPLRIEERTRKIPDGAGGLIEERVKFPVWFEPVTSGGTPMCEGIRRAAEVLASWCDAHPNSYPPTVIHVSDGQSTDGDPEALALQLQQLATNDGQVLVFNLHIDSLATAPVFFPDHESLLPDQHSQKLFRMSSPLPQGLRGAAAERGYNPGEAARFFCYKGGYEAIVDFFDIGTRAAQLR